MGLRRFLKTYLYKNKFKKSNYSINLKNKNILITGSNSGIGFALTKILLEKKNIVHAIVRLDTSNLDNIRNDNLNKINCDLKDVKNFVEIEKKIGNANIDVIFNCAGVYGGTYEEQSVEKLSIEKFKDVLMINALSVLKIIQIILKKSKPETVVNISSDAGSINLNNRGDHYFYRISKSTMNAITKNLSIDLFNKIGTSVFSVDPGNVSTNMNPNGLISSEECAKLILDLTSRKKELNGKFVNLLGQEIPW
tara:strand:- start:276 stop:1028 length:753 start_codon:yes stop_codon:yes gene_type:complete